METEKPDWLIDVPVAINFFARSDTFEKTFREVCKARPNKLFLIADGPRPNNPHDIANSLRCKEIAFWGVNWKCEIYQFYNEENKGLFHTYFDSMSKVFQIVDRCIFLEDDVVCSQSFFRYCKEMLDKYENDQRISYVTGINLMLDGVYENVEADYFFSGEGSLQAYGLWKRTFDKMNMDFLSSPYAVEATKKLARKLKPGYEKRITKYECDLMWQGHIPHVEIYKNLSRLLEWQLCIVPKKNLVTNIGVGANSTHTSDDIRKMAKAKWVFYTTPIYELEFPLKDPQYVINDIAYEDRINYLTAWNKPMLAFSRRIEAIFRHLIYGDIKRVVQKFKFVLSGKYVFDE